MYSTRIYISDSYTCVCMYRCVSVCTCLCMHVIMRILETSTTRTELSAHTAHANIAASAYIYIHMTLPYIQYVFKDTDQATYAVSMSSHNVPI